VNILLTGAAGFIGFHTAKKLLGQGHTVFGLDSLHEYYDINLKNSRLMELGIDPSLLKYGEKTASSRHSCFNFARLELENRGRLFPLVKERIETDGAFDRIVHLAAQAGVRYSLENPQAYIDSNITGFLSVLELARAVKIPHLVYASSSSVYGLNTKLPFSVHAVADHPVSLYAATKRSNELMAHTYAHLFGIPVTGLRFFTVYGPWGRPDMAYYKFAKAILRGEPIEVYNDGEMFRDFTYIDDITEGIVRAAERIPLPSRNFDSLTPDPSCSSAPYIIYNLGNHHPEKLSVFIEILENALGKKAVRKNLPMQAGDVIATEADIDDTIKDLGWSPSTNLACGLERFAQWFKGYHGV
jgi:UDP-glucuronate 4-epimerase